jgi:hypothetical protein
LDSNTEYFWRVKSYSGTYGESDWSQVRSFTTDAVDPELPVLNTPSDASTSTIALVNFSWNLADRATSYDFQIASDVGFVTIISNQTNLDTAFAQYTFTTNATYYWRVRSNNIYGSSAWATYRSIIINVAASDYRTNLIVEWDANVGVTSGGDGLISAWIDTIGALSASQATSGNRPKLMTNYKNGKNAVWFDGSTRKLAFTSTVFSNYTVFIVADPTSATAGDGNVLLGGTAGDLYTSLKIVSAGMGCGNGSLLRNSTIAADAGTGWGIRVFQSQRLYKNNTELAYQYTQTPPTMTLGVIGGRTVGGVFPWFGYVSEIRIYNAVLTLSEIQQVTNYLNAKYAIY